MSKMARLYEARQEIISEIDKDIQMMNENLDKDYPFVVVEGRFGDASMQGMYVAPEATRNQAIDALEILKQIIIDYEKGSENRSVLLFKDNAIFCEYDMNYMELEGLHEYPYFK